ncbi:hypothetical protein F5Y17DRAFT_15455 [Xylariaceae sp. FL0594]|nr:hypothetical protein F5Y17DRAFT_15455 [Xylariaceae sp. FL0594]
MDTVSAYSFASGGWNALQAIPLIFGPTAIASLLAVVKEHEHSATTATQATVIHVAGQVETYLSRSLGFALLALGLVTIVLTGSLPVGSVADTSAETHEHALSPYASPVMLLTTLHHGAAAFHTWTQYDATAKSAYLLGFAGNAALAAFGVWALLFAGERRRVSRKTGADKRTSGFPFGDNKRKLG